MREGSNTARRQCSAWDVELSAIRRAKVLIRLFPGADGINELAQSVRYVCDRCWFTAVEHRTHLLTYSVQFYRQTRVKRQLGLYHVHIVHSGVGTGGSGGSMNRGRRAPGAPE